MSENRKEKNSWKTATIVIIIIFVVVTIFFGIIVIAGNHNHAQNMAYAKTTVHLYAGPDTSYAIEEELEGYFSYEKEENGWLTVERKNSEDEIVLRWVNTDDLSSWGTYQYNTNTRSEVESTTE